MSAATCEHGKAPDMCEPCGDAVEWALVPAAALEPGALVSKTSTDQKIAIRGEALRASGWALVGIPQAHALRDAQYEIARLRSVLVDAADFAAAYLKDDELAAVLRDGQSPYPHKWTPAYRQQREAAPSAS